LASVSKAIDAKR